MIKYTNVTAHYHKNTSNYCQLTGILWPCAESMPVLDKWCIWCHWSLRLANISQYQIEYRINYRQISAAYGIRTHDVIASLLRHTVATIWLLTICYKLIFIGDFMRIIKNILPRNSRYSQMSNEFWWSNDIIDSRRFVSMSTICRSTICLIEW